MQAVTFQDGLGSDEGNKMSNEKITELEKENAAFKLEIENLKEEARRTEKIRQDLWSHEIYLNARKKMFAGVALLIAILGGLGLYTLYEFYQRMTTYLEKEAKTQLTEKLGDKIDEFLPDIVKDAKHDLTETLNVTIKPALEKEIKESVENIREDALTLARNEINKETQQAISNVRTTITTTALGTEAETRDTQKSAATEPDSPDTSTNMYFVIAGSSPVRDDLSSERERVRMRAEHAGKNMEEFPETKIYPPYGSNRNYALIVGGPLPLEKTRELRQHAIEYVFRDDSFVWSAERRYFDLN